MADTREIIKAAREQGTVHFEKLALLTNQDMGHRMVTFCTRTLHTRKINDWGRDVDTDLYIGLDVSGWIRYTQEMEAGAGPREITDSCDAYK